LRSRNNTASFEENVSELNHSAFAGQLYYSCS